MLATCDDTLWSSTKDNYPFLEPDFIWILFTFSLSSAFFFLFPSTWLRYMTDLNSFQTFRSCSPQMHGREESVSDPMQFKPARECASCSKSNVAFQHLKFADRDKSLTWRVYFLAKTVRPHCFYAALIFLK